MTVRKFYQIPKNYLLLVAGLVWFAAGVNIIRIGITVSDRKWSPLAVAAALAVFGLFYGLIFHRLIRKHTVRITGYDQNRIHILRFFDVKSYCIMAGMMTFGILLRRSQLWPAHCIRTFYTGLGASLLMAGAGFLANFILEQRGCRDKDSVETAGL